MPADVIAIKADLAPDRKLAVPSSVRVGISLVAIRHESRRIEKLALITFGQLENTRSNSHLPFPLHSNR
jgi:hypothetical protein